MVNPLTSDRNQKVNFDMFRLKNIPTGRNDQEFKILRDDRGHDN